MANDVELLSNRQENELSSISDSILSSAYDLSENGLNILKKVASEYTANKLIKSFLPIICREDKCPWCDTCFLYKKKATVYGERCPIEIVTLELLMKQYISYLGISENNIVDLLLVRDLVDIELKIMRTQKKFAQEGDFEREVVVGIDNIGSEITKPELAPHVMYYDMLLKQKTKILEELMATRKASTSNNKIPVDAASLFKKVLDGTYSEVQNNK
jgi:hypothetical protein